VIWSLDAQQQGKGVVKEVATSDKGSKSAPPNVVQTMKSVDVQRGERMF
jgi:hypothetical protein